MALCRKQIMILLETATTVEEADEVINKNFAFESIEEKIAFLKGMFDVEVVGHEGENTEVDYFAMLATIIH